MKPSWPLDYGKGGIVGTMKLYQELRPTCLKKNMP